MPYIKPERRRELGETPVPRDAGELNYMITMLIRRYAIWEKLSYQRINDVVGALENAKLEFYRRLVGPYEETAIIKNGDVYGIGPIFHCREPQQDLS